MIFRAAWCSSIPISNMINHLSNIFILFWRDQRPTRCSGLSVFRACKEGAYLCFLLILIDFVYSPILLVLRELGLVIPQKHPVSIKILEAASLSDFLMIFMWIAFVLPALEELIFRLGLTPNPKNIVLFLSFFLGFVIYLLLPVFEMLNTQLGVFYFPILTSITGLSCFVFLSIILSNDQKQLIKKTLTRHLRYAILLSCLLFAGAHYKTVDPSPYPAIYILTLFPFFCSAYVLTYTRLRLGFVGCISVHAFNNFLLTALGVLILN